MKFFFDRCMSINLCKMVSILESGRHDFTHHDEDARFTQKTPDTEWISAISCDSVRPIVVSGDAKILKRPDEVAELQKSKLTFFVIADHWASLGIYDMAWKFLKVWPDILKEAAVREPTVYKVRCGKSQKVEKFCLTKDAAR